MAGVSVRARKESDGSTITTLTSDANGFVTWAYDGHPEPYYLHISDIPGGDKYWRSGDASTAGVVPLKELPAVLRALGDGVTRGYANALAVSLVSGGPSVSVATGAANVAGHPFVTYNATGLTNSRPSSGTRIDRIIVRLYPEGSATTPGYAYLTVLAGTVDAGTPALTQTSTVHEVTLATVTVPSAGAIVLTDERAFAGERLSDQDVARVASITTTSAAGEALSGLSVTLDLPRDGTYDIEAELTAQQRSSASTSAWVLQATYGTTTVPFAADPNFDTPAQVAVDSSGNVFVADTANARLMKLNSSGAYVTSITGMTGITGVCVDSSNAIYVTFSVGNVRKYNSSLILQWSQNLGAATKHITTDSTHVYITDASGGVYKRLCSTGALPIGVSSWGGGLGAFWGVTVGGGEVFVVDATANLVRVYTTSGVVVRSWAITASARGCALDASGDVLVAEYGQDAVKRYTNTGTFIDSFTQIDPDGIGVATGDVLWVSNATDDTIAKWDEAMTPGGYGDVAIEIDGSVSTYLGIGNRDGAVATASTGSKAGPSTVLVRAFARRTTETMTLSGAVLSARAVPAR